MPRGVEADQAAAIGAGAFEAIVDLTHDVPGARDQAHDSADWLVSKNGGGRSHGEESRLFLAVRLYLLLKAPVSRVLCPWQTDDGVVPIHASSPFL
jgi:hypothetical protein